MGSCLFLPYPRMGSCLFLPYPRMGSMQQAIVKVASDAVSVAVLMAVKHNLC